MDTVKESLYTGDWEVPWILKSISSEALDNVDVFEIVFSIKLYSLLKIKQSENNFTMIIKWDLINDHR